MMWEIAGMPKVLRASPDELRTHIDGLVEAYEEERLLDPFGLGPTGNASSAAQWLMDTMSSDFAFLAATELISQRLTLPGGCAKVFRYQFNGYGGKGDAFHSMELLLLQGEDHEHEQKGWGKPEVRQQMLGAWASFVRSGDPNMSGFDGTWQPHGDPG